MTKKQQETVIDQPKVTAEKVHKIELYKTEDLIPYDKNPRKISDKAILKVASSIKEFGFLNPIIIDKDNIIVAGHTRLKACAKLGIKTVPVIKATELTPAQIQVYRLADNRTGEESEWDKELLSIEIADLEKLIADDELNIDLNISSLGFDPKELEALNSLRLENEFDENDPTCDEDYNVPKVDESKEAITKRGDIWQLGKHRLMCGDSTNFSDVEKLMDNKMADMIFTDPPYNVKIKDVVGQGIKEHSNFAMACGEMSVEEFTDFLANVFTNYIAFSKKGSIHYVCMDWKHIFEIISAGRKTYAELKQLCVWNKDIGGMGTFYRNKHELIFIFKNGKEPHTNNFELGQNGRYRTNVWDYASPSSFAGREALEDENGKKLKGTSKELSMHPTVKPLKMVIDAILDCSNKGELITDLFLGSGTTLIAAEKTECTCYGMEISPHYCDVIVRRWEEVSGERAVLT